MKPSRPSRPPSGRDKRDRRLPYDPDRPRPPRYDWKPAETDDRLMIFGIHAVDAALANDRRKIKSLWLTENAERRLAERLTARGLKAERVSPKDLDRRLGADTVHQGALIEAGELPDYDLDEIVAEAAGRPLVVLDQVTDPHNVGAVMRSCAVFGAGGLIMTRRNSPPLGGALAKAASGALEAVPVALVQNLARALTGLRERGFRLLGLDGAASVALEDEPLTGQVAFVLGAEGRGLRELTRQTCDALVRIEADGSLTSLNVSNAAAVALHFAAFRRRAG